MKRNVLDIPKVKKGDFVKATLSIDGELSFINASSILGDIQTHMHEFDQLNVQASLAHIDLTGIQILYSIKKSCTLNQKNVVFNIKMNEELTQLVLRSGFKELFEIQTK
jgi:anti-anti-sigma regulatory factor